MNIKEWLAYKPYNIHKLFNQRQVQRSMVQYMVVQLLCTIILNLVIYSCYFNPYIPWDFLIELFPKKLMIFQWRLTCKMEVQRYPLRLPRKYILFSINICPMFTNKNFNSNFYSYILSLYTLEYFVQLMFSYKFNAFTIHFDSSNRSTKENGRISQDKYLIFNV